MAPQRKLLQHLMAIGLATTGFGLVGLAGGAAWDRGDPTWARIPILLMLGGVLLAAGTALLASSRKELRWLAPPFPSAPRWAPTALALLFLMLMAALALGIDRELALGIPGPGSLHAMPRGGSLLLAIVRAWAVVSCLVLGGLPLGAQLWVFLASARQSRPSA